MVAIGLAAALVGLAGWSMMRLAFMHPLQLWSVPWALATSLFAFHLLPYRPLSASTALLIGACTTAFAAGCTVAARWLDRRRSDRVPVIDSARGSHDHVTVAALVSVVLTGAGLMLYLVELSLSHGLRDTLVTSPQVRLALADGAAAVTIKYLYVAYASAALCGLAAARAPSAHGRILWLGLGAAVVGSQYFTTGRSNIVLALCVLAAAEALGRRRQPSMRTLVAAGAALAAFVLAVFTAGGAIIGKTLDNNPLASVSSPLTEERLLRPLALPYQYASAPIAGLEVQSGVADAIPDALGCASFAMVCQIGRGAGFDMAPEPLVRPFTQAPLPWNTYTALDLPLVDGGPLFAILYFALLGCLAGALWRVARKGSTVAVAAYAIYASALLYSATQNNFFAPHIVGACVIAALLLAGARLVRRRGSLGSRPRPRLLPLRSS